MHILKKSSTFAVVSDKNKMKKTSTKESLPLKEWYQSAQEKIHSSKEWTQEHVEELHRKQESYGETEEAHKEKKAGRITFLTAVRIIMAELGEKEYWQTLWQLFWRPGYMMSDFINGKGRRYLKPFQLLIGTTLLLAIVLTIVPAKVEKGESYEEIVENALSKRDWPPEASEIIKPAWTLVKQLDKYRVFKEEHMAFNVLSTLILPVFFTWLLFRKSPRRKNEFVEAKEKQANYNFPEIVTIEIFVAAQLQFINTLWVFVVGWIRPELSFSPFVFPGFVTYIVMFIDYQQLFGRKWYDTLWRTIFCVI